MRKINKSAKVYSLSFIAMLVISTMAFAFLIGSETKTASAEDVLPKILTFPTQQSYIDAVKNSEIKNGDLLYLKYEIEKTGTPYYGIYEGSNEIWNQQSLRQLSDTDFKKALEDRVGKDKFQEAWADMNNKESGDAVAYTRDNGEIVRTDLGNINNNIPKPKASTTPSPASSDSYWERALGTKDIALTALTAEEAKNALGGSYGGDTKTYFKTQYGAIIEKTGSGTGKVVSSQGTDKIFGGKVTVPFAVGQLVEGVVWSMWAVGAIQLFAPIFGTDKDETNALTIAAMSGIMAGKLAYSILGHGGIGNFIVGSDGKIGTLGKIGTHPATSIAIGAVTAWLVYNKMHKKEKTYTESVTFTCLPWQAPNGGKDSCELCNDKTGIPCSEYRCKSLGQSCQIQNAGTSREMCVDANPRDVSPPVINPSKKDLTEGYVYTDVKDMPPGAGFKIKNSAKILEGGCIKPFTPITFGIETDEPAQCKIDVEPKGNYSKMATYFGGDNLYAYNHTEVLSLPSVVAIKNSSLNLQNGRELSFFIRCKDTNGNTNEADYELKLCVDPSDDTTAPEIQGTNIVNGGCIKADADNATVDFYINEPSDCRWSFTQNQDYNQMQNNMSCSNSVKDINALLVYPCSAQLTGVARDGTNFYVRCLDQPTGVNESKRNPNRNDYVFSLRGSNILKLKNIAPTETVYGAVRPAPVELYAETTNGCDNNKAICSYSTTGQEGSYIPFYDTNNIYGIHTQRLDLYDGLQTYFIQCTDSGGNQATNSTTFNMEIDTNAPVIARAYEEDDYLKLVTPRDSDCVFTNDNCDYVFSDGIVMQPPNATGHITPWFAEKTYYIKCRDEFRTEPADCSMVVRPLTNFYEDKV